MIDLNFLDTELAKVAVTFRNQFDRTAFTEQIKLLFASLYTEDDIFCYASGISNNDFKVIHGSNEFKYDLIVLRESKELIPGTNINFILNTLLSLETELDQTLSDVVVDFQKLLVSNSMEKVMVFRCHSTEFEHWNESMVECVNKYIHANGVFHFIAYLNDLKSFTRRTIKSASNVALNNIEG